jgi:hypothetical protein
MAGVISLMLADVISNYLHKPKVIIDTCRKKVEDAQNYRISDLGFTVSVKRKMVKDARVRCNGKKYSWVEEDGQPIERKDLDVGDFPAQFFPFEGTLEYRENMTLEYLKNVSKLPSNYHWVYFQDKQGKPLFSLSKNGVLITLKDKLTKEIILSNGIVLPNFEELPKDDLEGIDIKSSLNISRLKTFDISIRLIGEGIEEEKDYVMSISICDVNMSLIKDKLALNQIKVSFNLKPKKRFYFKNQDFTLAF